MSRWFDWRSALAIVRPETLIDWHRAGFRFVVAVEVSVRATTDSEGAT